MFKKIALSLCFTLFLGLLSACGPTEFLRLKKAESPLSKEIVNAKTSKGNVGISSPVALPPAFKGENPFKSPHEGTTFMPNGLPALKPMGINVDAMFSEKIKNSDQRFGRVENAVIDLRKEFDSYRPSIVRLAAVEADIQNLIKELEVLLQETPASEQPLNLIKSSGVELQVSQLEPQPLSPPELPPAVSRGQEDSPQVKVSNLAKGGGVPKKPPKLKVDYEGVVAKNLRVGEHADKLRLVFDTNERTAFTVDLDNDEGIIIIELPDARWVGAMSREFKGGDLLESYGVESISDGSGSMIILSLKKSTKILRQKRLVPDGSPYHRIYFDLSR